jgi:branched-chain amino acid transport system substrate-binding protein
MRRLVPFATGLAVALVLVAGCGDDPPEGPAGEAGPIRIGQIASLTGNYQPLGTEDQKAVQLAVDEVNAGGGLLGRQIELIVKDDKSQPDQSVLAWSQLMDSEVAAVIGSPFSNSALATIPRVDRDEIPYISLTPADEQVEPIHPYVFVVPALSGTYAERMLQYFQATDVTTVAVAYDTRSAYAVAGFTGMQANAQEYGITLLGPEEFQTDTTDFSAVFTRVGGTDAQALVVWATGPPAVGLTRQYADAGLDIPLVLTGAQASPLFLEPAGPAAEGVTVLSSVGVVGSALPDGALKTAVDDLTAAYQDTHGYPPPQFAQDGYSGAQLLFAAIEQAGGTEPEAIRDALEALNLVTPNGVYQYSGSDHSGLAKEYISVNTVENGEFVPTDWAREQLATLTGA